MATLSEQIYYISVPELQQAFLDGTWAYCRPEYYIRQGIDDESVAQKRVALISNQREIEVKEAFAVEKHPETGVLHIVSGNTRARAIFELWHEKKQELKISDSTKEGKEIVEFSEEQFKLVPYRLFEEPLSLEDAIDFQTSTNDFTKKHNPFDIALLVYNLKPQFEKEFISQGMAEKKAQGEATRKLCLMFKRSKQNLSQYSTVMEKGTPKLHEYIKKEKISVDAANTLIQKVSGTKPSDLNEAIDKVIDSLWIQAQANALRSNDGKIEIVEDFSIYKSAILNYFDTLKSAAAEAGVTTPTDETVPPASVNGKPATPTRSSTVTKERYEEGMKAVTNRIITLDAVQVAKPENVKNVREFTESVFEFAKVHSKVLGADTILSLFELAKQIVERTGGDVLSISDEINQSSDDYDKFHKSLDKMAAAIQNLLPKPEPVAPSETVVSEAVLTTEEVPAEDAPLEPITIETEEHLITAK